MHMPHNINSALLKGTTTMSYKVRTLSDSIKFYLPRTEGYLEIIRHIRLSNMVPCL